MRVDTKRRQYVHAIRLCVLPLKTVCFVLLPLLRLRGEFPIEEDPCKGEVETGLEKGDDPKRSESPSIVWRGKRELKLQGEEVRGLGGRPTGMGVRHALQRVREG